MSSPASKPAVLEFFFRLLAPFSFKLLFRLSRWCGRLLLLIPNRSTAQTRSNIALCFPELNPAEQAKLVRESLNHLVATFVELAGLWYRDPERTLACIEKDAIGHEFETCEQGRLVIVPHQGSWETMIYWLGQQGQTLTLYKPARKAGLDRLLFDNRSRNGVTMVPTNTTGLRQLLKGLKQHKTCMVLPDQIPGEHNAYADAEFFAHPARTSLLIKKLAEKSACEVFIAAIVRDLEKGQYRVSVYPVDKTKILADDAISARYMNQQIEALVLHNLEQYQWAYRRFDAEVYQSFEQSRAAKS